ncbi:calcium-binding protein, partial [Methylomonas sp. MgM2]
DQGLKLADYDTLTHDWSVQDQSGEIRPLAAVLSANATHRAELARIAALEEAFVVDWRTHMARQFVNAGFTQLDDGRFEKKPELDLNYDFFHYDAYSTPMSDQEYGYLGSSPWEINTLGSKTVALSDLDSVRGFDRHSTYASQDVTVGNWSTTQFDSTRDIYSSSYIYRSKIVSLPTGNGGAGIGVPVGTNIYPTGIPGQYKLTWYDISKTFKYTQQQFHLDGHVAVEIINPGTGPETDGLALGRSVRAGSALPGNVTIGLEKNSIAFNLLNVSGTEDDDIISFEYNSAPAVIVKAGGGNDFVDAWNWYGEGNEDAVAFLDGGDGNDILMATSGDDVLIGGSGVNYLLGKAGNDRYMLSATGFDIIDLEYDIDIIAPGYGFATIAPEYGTDYLTITESGIDILELPEDVTPAMLTTRFSAVLVNGEQIPTLELSWQGQAHTAIMLANIDDRSDITPFENVTLLFGDGSESTLDELLAATPPGFNDFYVWGEPFVPPTDTGFIEEWQLPLPTAEFSIGMGSVTTRDYSGGIVFDPSIVSDDVTLLKSGNDLLVSVSGGTDSLRLVDWYLQDYEPWMIFDDDEWSYYQASEIGTTLIGTAGGNTMTALDDYGWTLLGNAGNDTLIGNAGDDVLVGGSGSDILFGGDGDDTFVVEGVDNGYDRFEGGGGFDTIVGGGGDDLIRLHQFGGDYMVERIDGGLGLNTIAGTGYGDTIDLSGTEVLNVAAIDGGAGNDTLIGNAGDDVLVGGRGSDILSGGDDTFVVEGVDSGYDRFEGGAGFDTIVGGGGDDLIRLHQFGGAYAVERIDGGLGSNTIAGTGYGDTIDLSGTELLNIAAIDGGAGNDTLTGSAAGDVLIGGSGSDTLAGGDGDDTFVVEGVDSGYDRFEGGAGFDTIMGGDGDDVIRL